MDKKKKVVKETPKDITYAGGKIVKAEGGKYVFIRGGVTSRAFDTVKQIKQRFAAIEEQ